MMPRMPSEPMNMRSGEGPASDVLSDVLRAVRLTGAVFFVTQATSPWVLEIPDGGTLAPAILPGAQNVLSYHVVINGSGWGSLRGGPPVPLEAGDVDAAVRSAAIPLPRPTGNGALTFPAWKPGPR